MELFKSSNNLIEWQGEERPSAFIYDGVGIVPAVGTWQPSVSWELYESREPQCDTFLSHSWFSGSALSAPSPAVLLWQSYVVPPCGSSGRPSPRDVLAEVEVL